MRIERFWGIVNDYITRPIKAFVEYVENVLLHGDCIFTGDNFDPVALGALHRVLVPAAQAGCDDLVRTGSIIAGLARRGS